MSSKKSQIFDTLIGLIPLFILIYLEPKRLYIYVIAFLIYVIYLSFKPKIKFFWKKSILNELNEKEYLKKTKNISELTTSKTVTRRTNYGGYETLNFEFKYNPNVKVFNLRLLAKLIDILFYYSLIFLLIEYYKNFNVNILFVSFILLFIISPIFETLAGRTLGKLITGLEVVDDNCEKPYILKSYARNILPLYYVVSTIFLSIFTFSEFNIHNDKTKTYTIRSKEKKKIIEMMNEK